MGSTGPRLGEVLLVAPAGVPDLLRVERVGDGRVSLRGDADPGERVETSEREILARAVLPRRVWSRGLRLVARECLDLAEALRGRPSRRADAAETVRAKYEEQAPFYETSPMRDLDPALLGWVRASVGPGGTVLVVGSGTGRETFALASAGFRARGIDYAPAMVAASLRESSRRGADVRFEVGDLRAHEEPAASLDAVFFTYDVYSFLPGSAERVTVLRKIRSWLKEGGVVFLSARTVPSWRGKVILTLQYLRGIGSGSRWGESHTRWIDPGGNLRRSFVQCFLSRAIEEEILAGGFETDGHLGGHARLRVRPGERP